MKRVGRHSDCASLVHVGRRTTQTPLVMIDGSKTAIFSLHKCLGKSIGRLKSILPAGRVGQFVAGEREDVGGILCATIESGSANEHERIPCLSIHTSPKHFYFIRKNV